MNRMQKWLASAAEELGIRIVVGYVVRLPDGRAFLTQAFLPDLGGALGTLVFDSSDELDAATRRVLAVQGYSVSTFSAPMPDEQYDVDSYAEMFSEWGWTSNESLKPAWMQGK